MTQASPYFVPLLLAAIVSALLAALAWQRRRARGALALVGVMLGAAQWALSAALQTVSASLEAQVFWFRLRFIGTEALSVSFFIFAVLYLNRARLRPPAVAGLLLLPVINLGLLWTNDAHHLFYTQARLVPLDGFAALDVAYGAWFWVHTAYDYALLGAALWLFARAFARSPRLYRGQIVSIVASAGAPLVANALTISGLSPFPYLDLTPFGFTITALSLAAGFVGFGMLDIVPAARDAVLQSLDDAVFIVDPRGRLVDLNPAAERVLGQGAASVIGQPLDGLLPGWQPAAAGGRGSLLRLSPPAAKGAPAEEREYEVRASAVTDQGGRLTGRAVLLRDLTERLAAEASLRQSQARFDEVIESIVDSYYEVDLAGTLVFVNRAFCDAVNYPRDEIIGRPFRALTDRRNAVQLYRAFNTVYQTGQPLERGEYVFRRADGSEIHAELSVVLRYDADGQPIGFRGIIRDMTERRRAQQELQRAKEAAEAASRAKSTFLTTVSHELRTPLTSVLGFAKLIKKRMHDVLLPALDISDRRVQRASQQVDANLDIIVAEGERLTALINNLLDLAKIEAGKVEWNMQPLAVSEVVNRAVAATTSLADHKGLRLVTDLEPNLPPVVGDQDRLIQVVINLISNAVKFTEQGSVTCRAWREDAAVLVSVCDTGIGIQPDDLARVFDQFVQVGNTLTDKPTGTGLGLPICKQIVEHHGGKIWAESEPGQGSTFTFSLPLAGEPSRPAEPDANSGLRSVDIGNLIQQLKATVASTGQPAARKSVLIVDDDANIRELLRQELEADGYAVTEAHDGRAALACVKQVRPDLIILDVMMPELTGFDVAAVLRSDPDTRTIPIIILSVIHDRERGFRVGVDRYFTKPVEAEVLLREVSQLLSEGQSRKTVLVVDENAAVVNTLTEVLQAQGYSVAAAHDTRDGIAKALSARPDLVIVNSLLPDQAQLVKTLRFEKGLENVSFLLFH